MQTAAHPHTSQPTPAPAAPGAPEQLLRLPQTLAMVGLGRSAWLDLVKSGRAPQPVKLGRATAWPASEVQAWIAARIRDARAGGTK